MVLELLLLLTYGHLEVKKRGFMAITAHFVDDSWNLQSCVIRFAYAPCPHTAKVLTDVLHEC